MIPSRQATFLALTLVVSLAASGRAAEPDKLLPPDANAVAVLNVRQTLDAPVIRKYAFDLLKTQISTNVDVKAALEAIGLDPFKDVDSLLLSISGKMDKDGNIFAAVRGSFDPEKIGAQATKANVPSSKVGNLTIYEIKGAADMFLTVLDKKTILGSNKKDYLVKAATGVLKQEKSSEQLKAALARTDGTHSLILGIVLTEDLKGQMKAVAPGNDQVSSIVDKLESVSGSINLTADADVKMQVNTADAKTADTLAGMINLFLPATKEELVKQPGVPPVVGTILTNMKVTSEKTSVVFNVKIADDMIQKAIEGK
jgi:hypothetical protein